MSVPKNLLHVIGCDHRIQRNQRCPIEPTPAQAVQLRKFETEIERLSNVHHFDLYCEETTESAFTFLRNHASAQCREYVNIDMPESMRTEFGIPVDLNRPEEHDPEDFKRWNELRENYMFETAMERMVHADRALFVCGDSHRKTLSQRFRDLGREVFEVPFDTLTKRLEIDLEAFSISAALREYGH